MTMTSNGHFDIGAHLLSLSLQDEGVWYALEPWIKHGECRVATDTEAAVRLRSWDNPKFRESLRMCHREHNPLGIERTQQQEIEAINDAMSRGLVTGLRGLRIDGKDITFDTKNVRDWLNDRRLPQLRTLCTTGSQLMANYREQVEERRAGN